MQKPFVKRLACAGSVVGFGLAATVMVGFDKRPSNDPRLADVMAKLEVLQAENAEIRRHVVQLRLDQRDIKSTMSKVAGKVGAPSFVIGGPLEDRPIPAGDPRDE